MSATDIADRIKITANRSDEEPWRLVRLHRITGYLCALSDDVLSRIASLHDHKGDLTVEWQHSPSDAEKNLVLKAWHSGVGDGGNVNHATVGLSSP